MAQTVEILGETVESDNFGYYHVEIGQFDCAVYEKAGKFQGDHTDVWESSIDGVFISEPHQSAQSAADALTAQLRVTAVAIVGFAGGEIKWPS